MKWRRGVGGSQIEDRRGQGGGGGLGGLGGGRGFPRGAGAGVGGLGIIGVIIALLFGGNVLGGGGGGFNVDTNFDAQTPAATGSPLEPAEGDDVAQFVAFVVDNVQGSWTQAFAAAGERYEPTTLVLFEDQVSTGCGNATSATGPFYCPADFKVYLDLGFFNELRSRFGAPGDFAQAYVIAHEFGHHVQNLLRINEQVRAEQQQNPDDANDLSVRLELQADCLAGVWAHSAYELLEQGDVEEGLAAAAAVGDDRIQRESTGQINPDTWTHGSSEQRMEWFQNGFEDGDIGSCDTFS